MTFTSNVQPRRRVRLATVRRPWECKCVDMAIADDAGESVVYKQQPAALNRCMTCLEVRP